MKMKDFIETLIIIMSIKVKICDNVYQWMVRNDQELLIFRNNMIMLEKMLIENNISLSNIMIK
jgi:hypothetical protein